MRDPDWDADVRFKAGGPQKIDLRHLKPKEYEPGLPVRYEPRSPAPGEIVPLIDPFEPPHGKPANRMHVTAFAATHRLAFGTLYTPRHYEIEALRRLSNREYIQGADTLVEAYLSHNRWRFVTYYLAVRGIHDALTSMAAILAEYAAGNELKVWGQAPTNSFSPRVSGILPPSAFFNPARIDILSNKIGDYTDLRFDLRDELFDNSPREAVTPGEAAQPAANDAEAWRLRPAEQLYNWYEREEAVREGIRRVREARKKLTESSFCAAFATMAEDCGCPPTTNAGSIRTARRENRALGRGKKLPE